MIDRRLNLVFLSVLASFFLFTLGMVDAEEKITIGLVEDVILLPYGVKFPARIDTGAASSSLDARELRVQDGTVEFKLPPKYGGLRLRLPVVGWETIRSSESRESRPIVEMELCIGPKRLLVKLNLNDRSMVKYPLILGRNFLREDYVVDVKRRKTARPSCTEIR